MTKEEIKEMILGITKENTTDRLHAEILNAIVDAMPEGGGDDTITIDFGEVDFSGGRIVHLSTDKKNETWGLIYGHSMPSAPSEIMNDIINTPKVYVSPFTGKNYDGFDAALSGWVYAAEISEDGAAIYFVSSIDPNDKVVLIEF